MLNFERRFLDYVRVLWQRVPTGTRRAMQIAFLGVCVGLISVAFHDAVEWLYLHTIVPFSKLSAPWFLVSSFASVVGASTLASWLIGRFAPTAGGGGIMPTKIAFWKDFGVIPVRTAIVKFLGSILTLGGGVSMGPEGPAVQIGAASASALGGWMGVVRQERRVLCAAGAAAALAAAFNAPLAAILFVLEEIIGDLNSRLISGILLAAVMGALVAHALIGPQPAYHVATLGETSWRGLLLCIPVALVTTTAGTIFQKGAMKLRGAMKGRLGPLPDWLKPCVGAVFSWAIGAGVFLACGQLGVFGIGYADVTAGIAGNFTLGTALVLFGGKLVATMFAVGAGGCGGIFAPSFFIGAMGGASVVALASQITTLTSSDSAMLVMVGMCACLGAVIRTPLTCVLLIFEVTHQFSIIPLVLLATLISQLLSRHLHTEGMYEELLRQDGHNPERVLPPRDYKRWKEMHVGTIAQYQVVCVRGQSASELSDLLRQYAYSRFPVLGDDGRIVGIVTRDGIQQSLKAGTSLDFHKTQWISAADTLEVAQKRILDASTDLLCVGNASTGQLEGVVTLHDFLRAQQRLSDDAVS